MSDFVFNDELVPKTGYYKYHGHAKHEQPCDAFVPPQSQAMFFKKKQRAPKLGSCEHDIIWVLIGEYKS